MEPEEASALAVTATCADIRDWAIRVQLGGLLSLDELLMVLVTLEKSAQGETEAELWI